jgi:hypothetical protein
MTVLASSVIVGNTFRLAKAMYFRINSGSMADWTSSVAFSTSSSEKFEVGFCCWWVYTSPA